MLQPMLRPMLGVNCYYLLTRAVDESKRPGISKLLDALADAGITCIRAWAFADGGGQTSLQPSPGVLNERVLQGLFWLVEACRSRGLRLLLALTNYWPEYGGICQYIRWAEGLPDGAKVQNETFYINQSAQALYQQYVSNLLLQTNPFTGNRLCEEPTIFGWEVINEPRCDERTGVKPASMRVWLAAAVQHIKSLAPDAYVTIGTEGFWGTSTPELLQHNPFDTSSTGCDWALESSVPGLDVLSFHLYPDHWLPSNATPEQVSSFTQAWIESHASLSRQLQKPLMLTEFGSRRFVMQQQQQQPLPPPPPPAIAPRSFWSWLSKVCKWCLTCAPWPLADSRHGEEPATAPGELSPAMPRAAFVEHVLATCFGQPDRPSSRPPVAAAFLWMVAEADYPDYDGFTVHVPEAGHSEKLLQLFQGAVCDQPRWQASWLNDQNQQPKRSSPARGALASNALTLWVKVKQAFVKQAEEFMADGRAQAMRRRLQSSFSFVREAQDPQIQALARTKIPVAQLKEAAHQTWLLNRTEDTTGVQLNEEDYLAQELLVWFKTWFSWVNSPPCDICGSTQTHMLGAVAPTAEEAAHEASRTELHGCAQCNALIRFPRYNSVAKLLETRSGRCGEWANAFLTCCRAVGLDARYILDSTDHVWTECWSAAHGRWIHLDSCEAAYDKPMLYEAGWGKPLQYVTAIGPDGYMDVIHRYTQKWDEVKARRNQLSEEQLMWVIRDLTCEMRQGWAMERRQAAAARDEQEQQELEMRRQGHVNPSDLVGLGARTSGSEEWVRSRGEAGPQGPSATPAAPPPPASTPWSSVPTSLWAPCKKATGEEVDVFQVAGRLLGGGARAKGENGRHEGAARACDGQVDTKWLDFAKTSWLQYKLLPGQEPVEVVAYDVVSANDFDSRDPRDWVVEGLVPGENGSPGTWVQLDKQQGVMFNDRFQLRSFWLRPNSVGVDVGTGQTDGGSCGAQGPAVAKCVAWRLSVTATRQPDTDCLQLSCWNLYTRNAAWGSQQGGAPPGSAQAAAGSTQAAAQAARALVSATGDAALPPLVMKVLTELVWTVGEGRYKPVLAQRLVSLWSHTQTLAVLLAVGLRPLIQLGPKRCVQAASKEGGAGMLRGGLPQVPQQEMVKDVLMVLDADKCTADRARAVLSVLEGVSTGNNA